MDNGHAGIKAITWAARLEPYSGVRGIAWGCYIMSMLAIQIQKTSEIGGAPRASIVPDMRLKINCDKMGLNVTKRNK